ncbi:MAG: hypothetical protein WCI59_03860 [Betaproteobacteria bacterium]
MGQARIKQLNERELAFSKSRYCIFCGGSVPATTVDHYPPRATFRGNRASEGYVFPACSSCNSGSREADNWAGFLSMIDPSIEWSSDELERNIKRLVSLDRARPGLIREVFGGTVIEKKAMARRLQMTRAPGQTYADLPIVKVPTAAQEWMDIFAPKLTKALHYEHTRRIPPLNVGLQYWWYTNASKLEGRIPEIINGDFGFPNVRRANVDLSPQFNYGYQVSTDGELGLFVIGFRFAFMIISAITFDPAVADRVVRRARTSFEEGGTD